MNFIPVLLGSDMNVYGMARSFYEMYQIKSIAFGRMILPATRYSRIVKVHPNPAFENTDVFLSTLINFAKTQTQKLLLIACGDTYLELLIKHKPELAKYYLIPYIDWELRNQLESKEDFYQKCEHYHLDYPQTNIIYKENYTHFKPTFPYPIVLKPSNSAMYWKVSFAGKKKAFIAQTEDEKDRILHAIYQSSYSDKFIAQEMIPGSDSCMRVLNNYSNQEGKVVMQSMGHVLLEEHSPQGIGSHAAIIGMRDENLEKKVRHFLEDIGYIGFSNFDIKYDTRTGRYQFFEINLRQGRSSFYTTFSGCNLAKYLVEDYIKNTKNVPVETINPGFLWHVVPLSIIRKYVNDPAILKKVKEIIKKKNYGNSLFYSQDMNLKRRLLLWKELNNYKKKYKKYFGKKGWE